MKITVLISMMLLILTAPGCSKRNFYEGLRQSQEFQCEKLQGHDQQECLKRAGMSYDEYQKQLKERQK